MSQNVNITSDECAWSRFEVKILGRTIKGLRGFGFKKEVEKEHLYGAGFELVETHPRFLPLSFRGKLPVHKLLVRLYLKMPFIWFLFGKQFLIIAEKK